MLGGDPPLLSQTTSPNIIAQTRLRRTKFFPLRWKLLIITSLVAALFNAGGMRALAYWVSGSTTQRGMSSGAMSGLIVIPLVVTTLACIFVYRHTARRRKLQAALTAIFALALTLAALFGSHLFINF